MTLPSSGTMTTAQLAQELYGNSGATVTVPDAATRALTGKSTGALVFPTDFYGKSARYAITATFATYQTLTTGYSRGVYGSISPAYANVDGVTNAAGAAGQIDLLATTQDESTLAYSLELVIVGSYTLASLPFTTLRVADANNVTYNKSNATLTVSGGKTTLRWANTARLFAGSAAVVFA